MTAKDKRYAINTPLGYEQTASVDEVGRTLTPFPTNAGAGSYGFSIQPSQVHNEPTARPNIQNSPTHEPVYTGAGGAGGHVSTLPAVSAFYDLHITLTALVADLTATPYRATALHQPLYNRVTGACIQNCSFVTITPTASPKH